MAHDELNMRIAIAWRDLRRMRARPLSEAIPQGQLDTLDVISRLGPCNMVDLSTALRIDASSATRALDRLVDSGLAVRQRSDDDARTVVVQLTKQGRALARRLLAERLVQLEDALQDFGPSDKKTLADLLERLVAAVERSNDLGNIPNGR